MSCWNIDDVLVRVDHREGSVKEHLSIEFVSVNLELGDMDVEHGGMKWVFERKSISDLYSSIIDGRYHEQKQRLFGHYNRDAVTYIIEGMNSWEHPWMHRGAVRGCTGEMLSSAIYNMQYRDGVHVVFTKDVKDTCHFLEGFVKRVSKNKFDKNKGTPQQQQEYTPTTVKSKKKDNIDMRTCLSLQLSCIPGISLKTANKLMDELHVTNMQQLTMVLNEGDAKTILCKIPGIGKGLAKQIVEYIGTSVTKIEAG